jgi:predicted CoA-binding protein
MRYLLAQGYDVIPVRPVGCDAVLGVPCARTLAEIERPIDLVDVFRRPNACPDVARDAVAVGAGAVWLQLGIVNEEAAVRAEEAGLKVVMDRCTKIEIMRLKIPRIEETAEISES